MLKSALVFFGNQHACPEVGDVVFNQLDHRYVDVQEMALEACINLHSATLNQRFKERAGNDDPMQRMMAVYALGRYSVRENLPQILAALEDPSPRVRQVAVESFQNLGTEAATFVPQLLPRLHDEDKDVRLAVVDLLGQIGSPDVMPHIVDALKDANEWVRIRAIPWGCTKRRKLCPLWPRCWRTPAPLWPSRVLKRWAPSAAMWPSASFWV